MAMFHRHSWFYAWWIARRTTSHSRPMPLSVNCNMQMRIPCSMPLAPRVSDIGRNCELCHSLAWLEKFRFSRCFCAETRVLAIMLALALATLHLIVFNGWFSPFERRNEYSQHLLFVSFCSSFARGDIYIIYRLFRWSESPRPLFCNLRGNLDSFSFFCKGLSLSDWKSMITSRWFKSEGHANQSWKPWRKSSNFTRELLPFTT